MLAYRGLGTAGWLDEGQREFADELARQLAGLPADDADRKNGWHPPILEHVLRVARAYAPDVPSPGRVEMTARRLTQLAAADPQIAAELHAAALQVLWPATRRGFALVA